jgi:hypothetical protein
VVFLLILRLVGGCAEGRGGKGAGSPPIRASRSTSDIPRRRTNELGTNVRAEAPNDLITTA